MSNSTSVIDLLHVAVIAADDALAEDQVAIDVRSGLAFADIFLLLTADNQRHMRSLVEAVSKAVKIKYDRLPNVVEGDSSESSWMVVDYGDLVVHIFMEEERDYYSLDKLWASSPRIDIETLIDVPATSA